MLDKDNLKRDYASEIVEIVNSEISVASKIEKITNYHENDIAEALTLLSQPKRLQLYKILAPDLVAEIFSYIDDVKKYIGEIPISSAAKIISNMDNDDAVDILDELDEEEKNNILKLLDEDSRKDIALIYSYTEDEVGSILTSNFINISNELSVKEAMRIVIREAAENDNCSIIFVEDKDTKKYVGAIELRELIIARPDNKLQDIIKDNYPYVYAKEDMEDCLQDLTEYSLELVPVLNEKKQIVGAITLDDLLEAEHEEAREDYAKFAGLTEEEDIDDSPFASVKKRLPWLTVLLFLGLIVCVLTSLFETVVQTLSMVVFFQSFVLGMSGNSGTQSLAVTIATLNDEEINKKVVKRMILKELIIGFIDSLVIAFVGFIIVCLFIFVRSKIVAIPFDVSTTIKLSGVVSVSLLIAMTFSACNGTLVPLLLKKRHVDPAVASGPFITTLSDATSVVLYYGLAYILFVLIH